MPSCYQCACTAFQEYGLFSVEWMSSVIISIMSTQTGYIVHRPVGADAGLSHAEAPLEERLPNLHLLQCMCTIEYWLLWAGFLTGMV